MQEGTQARIIKEGDGMYMIEVMYKSHFRTRYLDCRKAPLAERADIIFDNVSALENKIARDIEDETARIKVTYKSIADWRRQIFRIINVGGCSEEAVTRHQTLGEVLKIIEEKFPEVKEDIADGD